MVEIARLLLDAGASPNTAVEATSGPHRGHRSASYAAAGVADNPPLTRLLLDRGAEPDDGESLYHAVSDRDPACLRLLASRRRRQGGGHERPARGDRARQGRRGPAAHPGRRGPGPIPPGGPAPTGLLQDLTINPLPAAAAADTAAVVEALLAAGADPNRPGRAATGAQQQGRPGCRAPSRGRQAVTATAFA
jgi:hypothetical protein